MHRLTERVKTILPLAVLVAIVLLLVGADPTALTVQGPRTQGLPLPIYTLPPNGVNSTQSDISATAFGANATQNLTFAATPGKVNYVTGIQVTGLGATAANAVQLSISGLQNANLQWEIAVPAGVTTGITPLVISFNPPLPGQGTNNAVSASLPAFGAGNTNATLTMTGYQQ